MEHCTGTHGPKGQSSFPLNFRPGAVCSTWSMHRHKDVTVTPDYLRCHTTPGQNQESMLHETAVSWIRRRLAKTRPKEHWTESVCFRSWDFAHERDGLMRRWKMPCGGRCHAKSPSPVAFGSPWPMKRRKTSLRHLVGSTRS